MAKIRFTENQIDTIADELIFRIFGTKTPSLSQIEVFLNMLIENENAMKHYVMQAAEIVEDQYEYKLIRTEKVLKEA